MPLMECRWRTATGGGPNAPALRNDPAVRHRWRARGREHLGYTFHRLRHRMLPDAFFPPTCPMGHLAPLSRHPPGRAASLRVRHHGSGHPVEQIDDFPRPYRLLSAPFPVIRCQPGRRPYTLHGDAGTEGEDPNGWAKVVGVPVPARRCARPRGDADPAGLLTGTAPGRPRDDRPGHGALTATILVRTVPGDTVRE